MKKTPSLFQRNYAGNRLVINQIVPGSEWVVDGEGNATLKHDGMASMIRNGRLYKRYDRKLKSKKLARRLRNGEDLQLSEQDFKMPPENWEPCEPQWNTHTGHWPGWVPVQRERPEDQYFWEAFDRQNNWEDGTYELMGPKIQHNPAGLSEHQLWRHGDQIFEDAPRDFEGLRTWLQDNIIEGIVWHHPDGRKVKIKRRDFGFDWPL